MFQMMVDWVSGSNWSYVAIFAVAVIDAFFPVVPSESMVIVAGTLAGTGDLNVLLVILAAWAGAVTGDNISYGIGKFAGERTVKRLFKHPKAHRGFDWAEQQLEERGSYIIIIARFIPFGRTAVTFTAGYTKGLPWHRFFRYDLVAGGVWATYATMLGYLGGKQFEEHPWKGVLLGLGIAFAVAFTVEWVRKRTGEEPRCAAVRVHVTGATGFLGSEVIATGPRRRQRRGCDVRDAAAVLALFARHSPRRRDPHRVSTGRRRCIRDRCRRVGERRSRCSRGRSHADPSLLRCRLRRSQGRLRMSRRTTRRRVPRTGGRRPMPRGASSTTAPDALIVRTSLIVGGPGHEPSKHELIAHDPAGYRSTSDEIRRRCRLAILLPRCSSWPSSASPGALNVAGADDVSRVELAELVVGGAVRRALAPPGRPLDCSLDSSRARALLRTALRGVREVLA